MGVVLNLGSSRRRDECYIPVISPALFSSHMAPWTKLSTDTQVSCRDRLIKQTPGAGPPPPWGRPHNPKLPANPGRLFSGLTALVLHHRRPGRSPRQDLHTHPKKPTPLALPAHIPPRQHVRHDASPETQAVERQQQVCQTVTPPQPGRSVCRCVTRHARLVTRPTTDQTFVPKPGRSWDLFSRPNSFGSGVRIMTFRFLSCLQQS